MDWKLISGVMANSIVEWIAENKEERIHLLHHMQRGYWLLVETHRVSRLVLAIRGGVQK
jgi:hypothetical protein